MVDDGVGWVKAEYLAVDERSGSCAIKSAMRIIPIIPIIPNSKNTNMFTLCNIPQNTRKRFQSQGHEETLSKTSSSLSLSSPQRDLHDLIFGKEKKIEKKEKKK